MFREAEALIKKTLRGECRPKKMKTSTTLILQSKAQTVRLLIVSSGGNKQPLGATRGKAFFAFPNYIRLKDVQNFTIEASQVVRFQQVHPLTNPRVAQQPLIGEENGGLQELDMRIETVARTVIRGDNDIQNQGVTVKPFLPPENGNGLGLNRTRNISAGALSWVMNQLRRTLPTIVRSRLIQGPSANISLGFIGAGNGR